MRWIVLATFAALSLAACSPASETTEDVAKADAAPPAVVADPSLIGFRHDQKQDMFGYYYPVAEVKIGDYRLDHVHIGGPVGFADWAAGKRTRTYGPVMLEFQDVTSPSRTNALGNTSYSVKLRVLPTAYAIDDGTVRFVGTDPKLGEVRLKATIDQAALRTARANPTGAAPVITGALQVGDTPVPSVAFLWKGGD